MSKTRFSIRDFTLWLVRSKERLVGMKSRADELFGGSEGLEKEVQQALDESVSAVSDLSTELLGLALQLIGSKMAGGDLKAIRRIEKKIERLKLKTETHIDKLSVLVSDTKHLS